MKPYDTRPIVSVLISSYNHALYVIATLESVAANDYPNIELIFIDDASQDDSYNLAGAWINENSERFVRIVQIRHNENHGICRTFNELLGLAEGEFVYYLASDDLVLTEGLSRQVSFSKEKKVDFLFSDCQLMDKAGVLIAESALEYFNKSKSKLLKNPTCFIVDVVLSWKVPWTWIFSRTEALRAMGGFDSSLSFEDRDFALKVLNQNSYAFLSEPTSCYRYTGGLTAGLSLEGLVRDLALTEIKNFHQSSGVIKACLWLRIYSYKDQHLPGGYVNSCLIFFRRIFFKIILKLIMEVHGLLIK